MIEISYANIMNGMNRDLNMMCICPSDRVAEHLFFNACELWYIKGFSKVFKQRREIQYGDIMFRFRNLGSINHDQWMGFRGIFLFHPDFQNALLPDRQHELLMQLNQHNERYLDKWRA